MEGLPAGSHDAKALELRRPPPVALRRGSSWGRFVPGQVQQAVRKDPDALDEDEHRIPTARASNASPFV